MISCLSALYWNYNIHADDITSNFYTFHLLCSLFIVNLQLRYDKEKEDDEVLVGHTVEGMVIPLVWSLEIKKFEVLLIYSRTWFRNSQGISLSDSELCKAFKGHLPIPNWTETMC